MMLVITLRDEFCYINGFESFIFIITLFIIPNLPRNCTNLFLVDHKIIYYIYKFIFLDTKIQSKPKILINQNWTILSNDKPNFLENL